METSVAADGYQNDDDRTGSFPMSFATGSDIPEVGRRALPPARLNDTESPEAQPRPKGPPTNFVCGEDGAGGTVYPPSSGRSDGGRRSPIDGRHLPSRPPKSSTIDTVQKWVTGPGGESRPHGSPQSFVPKYDCPLLDLFRLFWSKYDYLNELCMAKNGSETFANLIF